MDSFRIFGVLGQEPISSEKDLFLDLLDPLSCFTAYEEELVNDTFSLHVIQSMEILSITFFTEKVLLGDNMVDCRPSMFTRFHDFLLFLLLELLIDLASCSVPLSVNRDDHSSDII